MIEKIGPSSPPCQERHDKPLTSSLEKSVSHHCVTLNFSIHINSLSITEFFERMIGELPIAIKIKTNKIFISTSLDTERSSYVAKISQLVLTLFEKNIVHYKEICQYGPTIKAFAEELKLTKTRKTDNESYDLAANQLDAYVYILRDFISTKQSFIGMTVNQFLYQRYAFPMSETIGCFVIDFDVWHRIRLTNLDGFRDARDFFFDRDIKDISYSHIYSAIQYDVEVEAGYFLNLSEAFSNVCIMAQHGKLPTLKDVIHWHDIATKHLKSCGLRPENTSRTTCFPLSKHNATRAGWKELFNLKLVKENHAASCRTHYGCKDPFVYSALGEENSSIVGGKMYDHTKLHSFINQALTELEVVFLKPILEEDKLKHLIFFIKFIEVNHFFQDGNIRTCLLIFYYFIFRFKLPLTILSDPNIFDGFSVNEIYDDIVKGRCRYEMLRQGNVAKLKELSLAQ